MSGEPAMQGPLVSVVMPAYKATWLPQALESVRRQTYRPLELVVCDDSRDGRIQAIVEAFARQGAHVTFLDIANEPSRALQETLAHLPQPPVFRYCDLTDLGALAATFAEIARTAKEICPVSKVLKAVEITMDAKLV